MKDAEIIIIGGGAAGLAAAYELSLLKRKILLLEARNRLGGRIFTLQDKRFPVPVELGAEFIHGELPVTLQLLKKGNIPYHTMEGRMWSIQKGQIDTTGVFNENWPLLMKRLQELKEDMSIVRFLDTFFSDEKHNLLKKTVLQFVQGYDAADAGNASSLALRREWENEDDDHQYRIDRGYSELMEYLAKTSREAGNTIQLSSIVTQISWQKGEVEVTTSEGKKYAANKVLITVPLGVLQVKEESKGRITFLPALSQKLEAAQKMGFGAVIKIHMLFTSTFWEDNPIRPMKNASFIFSDAFIPTWWTQNPVNVPVLTGWLAGPSAAELKEANDDMIIEKAVRSLAYIFAVDEHFIHQRMAACIITNWTAGPFTRGAYSYSTLDTEWAKKMLSEPVEDTIFFAGEALYEGVENGTVEGAMANGIGVARKIIGSF